MKDSQVEGVKPYGINRLRKGKSSGSDLGKNEIGGSNLKAEGAMCSYIKVYSKENYMRAKWGSKEVDVKG